MKIRVSRPGTVINCHGICGEDCDWLIKINSEPSIPIIQETPICTLFHEVLNVRYKTGEISICEGCKTIKEEQ